ncbi:hypothetical protein GW17_00028803 [Ensete ventricosum]|nr:hypothetical protein GW17_00028803 [Ensete ventricosum]
MDRCGLAVSTQPSSATSSTLSSTFPLVALRRGFPSCFPGHAPDVEPPGIGRLTCIGNRELSGKRSPLPPPSPT